MYSIRFQAYLILAVVFGAALGHYVFEGLIDIDSVLSGTGANAKGMACH